MSEIVFCQNCGTENSIKTVFCQACGINLRELPIQDDETLLVRSDSDDMVRILRDRMAYFGRNSILVLHVVPSNADLFCDLRTMSFILGRGQGEDEDSHISLSEFHASDYGVSREHARITRMNFTILVEDLGALNGTYINGERLPPGKPVVLCDGDELRLANMALEVIFQKD